MLNISQIVRPWFDTATPSPPAPTPYYYDQFYDVAGSTIAPGVLVVVDSAIFVDNPGDIPVQSNVNGNQTPPDGLLVSSTISFNGTIGQVRAYIYNVTLAPIVMVDTQVNVLIRRA